MQSYSIFVIHKTFFTDMAEENIENQAGKIKEIDYKPSFATLDDRLDIDIILERIKQANTDRTNNVFMVIRGNVKEGELYYGFAAAEELMAQAFGQICLSNPMFTRIIRAALSGLHQLEQKDRRWTPENLVLSDIIGEIGKALTGSGAPVEVIAAIDGFRIEYNDEQVLEVLRDYNNRQSSAGVRFHDTLAYQNAITDMTAVRKIADDCHLAFGTQFDQSDNTVTVVFQPQGGTVWNVTDIHLANRLKAMLKNNKGMKRIEEDNKDIYAIIIQY